MKLQKPIVKVVDQSKVDSLSHGVLIEVLPEEIIFKDIQINQTYEITVFVRNLTKIARRIRVFQPKTSKFRADYDMQGAIAAGLAMKLVVTFETSVLEEYHDAIKIVSDGGFSIEVPLHAFPPQAGIIFEPFINLGFVRVNREKVEQIFFKNEGKSSGKVELRFDKLADFRIEPTTFTLASNQEFGVSVYYRPKEAGIFRGLIEVMAEGNSLQKTIDINATSIEFTRFLIDENGTQTTQFDFGTTYYGQLKTIETYLVNNTPRQQKFKVHIKQGLHNTAEEMGKLQTPSELGLEQNDRIMDCFPEEGTVDSYSQVPVVFRCRSKVSEKHMIWTRQFSMSNEDLKAESDEYRYSAIFEFLQDPNDSLITHLSARCICPTVKFPSSVSLQFGSCASNSHKEILFTLKNNNPDLPLKVHFPTIPYFSISPAQQILDPEQQIGFWASYKPKHTGSFQSTMMVELLDGVYKVPLKLSGSSAQFSSKEHLRRGPESLPQDFSRTPDEKRENSISMMIKKPNNSSIDLSGSIKSIVERQQYVSVEQIEELRSLTINREIYNGYLKNHRNGRLKAEKDKIIQQKYQQMTGRLKELGIGVQPNQNLNMSLAVSEDDNYRAEPPIDYEFEVGMNDNGIDQPKLRLPEAKHPLFVTKPIENYEPIKAEKQMDGKVKKGFNPDPNQIVRKKFPHEPKTHTEIRDTTMELSPEMLQKIDSGPVIIDFGHIYIRSKVTKTFYVKNEQRTSISVRLHLDRDELALSYLKKQIIPSGQTAGFDVVLMSTHLGSIKQNVKYIINERHIFEFMVTATIGPVQLELSRQQIKFAFSEDNIELETAEPLRITNNGNAPAQFRFLISERRIFVAIPEEGEVPAGGFLDLKVVYKPTQTANFSVTIGQIPGSSQVAQQNSQSTIALARNEDEKLTMKVIDGVDQSIKCSGIVNEPKCSIKQNSIDLKEVAVCKQEVKPLTIKNHSRTSAVYHVMVNKLPENVEISPAKGKILSEEQKDLQVRFYSKDERTVRGELLILIRGGRILKVPFVATTIIPKVEILQEEFNFGNITTLGNSITLKMTLVNNSTIAADLILDLRSEGENPEAPDGIECLEVKPADDADESMLHSVHEDEQSSANIEKPKDQGQTIDVELDAMADDQSEGSEPVELETKQFMLFNLTILGGKSVSFDLRFSPKEVHKYAFNVPLTLSRYGPLPGLQRQVLCRGLKPKFLIEPQFLEFKKKIISSPDKCFPSTMDLTLTNPDKREVQWKVDVTSLKVDKIFEIEPTQGTVKPGQQIKIKVKFNPFGPGSFEGNVPLFILSDPEISPSLPYVELQLSGQGAYPRLLFDKKEVILPVVPLNTLARCSFRILNDGYENLNLVHKWGQEVGNFNVELRFPEGKNLGITRSRLRVDIVFSHKKPLSFTTRLEFIDEARVYPINISGTTDNSLFTNFGYLQRQLGEFKISSEDKKPIMLVEDEDDVNSVDQSEPKSKRNKNQAHSSKSVRSSSSKGTNNGTSALGYTPLRQDQLEDSCDSICRWLNYHVLTSAISSFPDSVIEHNGQEIFELMIFLTGKQQFASRVNMEQQGKRVERAEILFKQYDELIRVLKIEGALLNHIRPEFLLSYPDYLAWLKAQPKDKFEFVPEHLLKLTLSRYQYVSTDSWIVLFYQILKIYYLGRITPKMLKGVPGVPQERVNVPEYYLEGSNLISPAEATLLWWYEVCFEMAHPIQVRRIGNFSTGFQDCQVIASAIQTYVGTGTLKLFQSLRMQCVQEEDFKSNAEKVIFALSEVGLQSHITAQDLYRPQQREILLFLIQLFFALPHYIPKSQPIIFQCVLGEEVVKSIDLTNPTGKAISYWANYEGHPDFMLEGDESFKIDPKQTYKYKIKFTSRVSQPVNGRVIFTNKKETNVQAAALVFELRSQITGRRSERQWTVQTALYEQFDFPITITNKFQFQEQAEFQILLVHERVIKDENKVRKKNKKNKEDISIPATAQSDVFPSYFCKLEKIRIKRGQQVSVTITYLPLTIDQHRCYVIFTDPNVGEMQHEVMGSVELPNMTGDIRPDRVLYVDTMAVMNFEIPFRNELMNKARKTIETMIMDKSREKISKGDKTISLNNIKINFPGGPIEQVQLECDIQPMTQYLSVPNSLTLIDSQKYQRKAQQLAVDVSQKEKKSSKARPNDQSFESKGAPLTASNTIGLVEQTIDPNSNKLAISYAFKNPVKDFNVLLTLKNSNKTDIRRYRIWANVLPKIVKSVLEFRVPARQFVTQEIPIVNNTEREWLIKVNLQVDGFKNGNLFTCPSSMIKELSVKKKSTGVFPLTFSPIWVQTAEARLVLLNPITNDVYEYDLKGFGEEPVAEEHIILNCEARKLTKREITLQNPFNDRTVTYRIETDLINATGPASLSIAPGKKGVYVLQVYPVLSGQYTGSITFTDDEGRYLWYTVFLSTDSPKSVQTLDINSVIRQATIFSVTLANPLDEPVLYEVLISGDGLVGESTLVVQPRDKGNYDLVFSPLRVGKWRGSVAFVSQVLGEVWYDLQLQSDEQQTQRLNVMKASLGKVEHQTVTLDNPSDQRVVVTAKITNPQNFDVYPEEIVIQPFDQAQVQLRYNPSSLDVVEASEIVLSSPIIGKWTYLVFGQGLPPTKFPITNVSIGLNKDYSSVVHFKNPFKEPISVNISLDAEGHNAEVFKLLLQNRKNRDAEKTLVPGMNIMQVPFSFIPREITCYYAEIVVAMNDKIQWRFPIKGMTESVNNHILFHFKSRCREKWEDEVKVEITGIVQSLEPDDRFDFEIGGVPLELQSMVSKCFQIKTVKNYIEHSHDSLVYLVRFQPMKPFKATIDFIVLRQSGGRWKFKIQLEATEPQEDDTIIISSPLNKTSSISFKLTNKVKSYARYYASFNPESDAEFSVMPKQGDLEPYGREGTNFIISFTPVEYGKIRKGKLVIQTEDMYWSYLIRGVLPRYEPPQAKESLLDDWRSGENVGSTMVPKNFLIENIRKSKNSPPQKDGGKSKNLFPSIDQTLKK